MKLKVGLNCCIIQTLSAKKYIKTTETFVVALNGYWFQAVGHLKRALINPIQVKDLDFFIHCESNGISSHDSVHISTLPKQVLIFYLIFYPKYIYTLNKKWKSCHLVDVFDTARFRAISFLFQFVNLSQILPKQVLIIYLIYPLALHIIIVSKDISSPKGDVRSPKINTLGAFFLW